MRKGADQIFAQWATDRSPGCAVAVVRKGRIVYKNAFGMADLEHAIPITPSTVFDIASMAKRFTAACVGLLEQRKALSLSDPIQDYVPGLASYEARVTVRHLLDHTSGLPDYYSLVWFAGRQTYQGLGEAEIMKLLSKWRQLNFVPGEQYSYSNTGYFLLGLIVKVVSGQSLKDFATENLFRPLGMKSSSFRHDFRLPVRNRAADIPPHRRATF